MVNGSAIKSIETTGRYLVLLPEGEASSGIRAITNATGVRDIDDSALLIQNAQRLALPSVDVGCGLVQAPV